MTSVLPQAKFLNSDLKVSLRETNEAAERGNFFVCILVCASIVGAVLWIPIGSVHGLGTITIADAISILLWAIFLVSMLLGRDRYDRNAVGLLVFLLAVPVCASVGALLFGTLRGPLISGINQSPIVEFLYFVKKFAIYSVFIVHVPKINDRRGQRIVISTVLTSLFILALFSFDPGLRKALPLRSALSEETVTLEDRATNVGVTTVRRSGTLANPNDYAYICVMLLPTAFIVLSKMKVIDARDRYALGLITILALLGIVLSASRSGLLGLIVMLAYLLLTARVPFSRKMMSIMVVGFVLVPAIQLSGGASVVERTSRALQQGSSEENLSGRIEMQTVAFRVAVSNPLGVGFTNLAPASRDHVEGTSLAEVGSADSVYFDTLAGAGILGLGALLLWFGRIWFIYPGTRDSQMTSFAGMSTQSLARAGLLSVLIIGLASTSPFAVAVAPFFFLMISCGMAE